MSVFFLPVRIDMYSNIMYTISLNYNIINYNIYIVICTFLEKSILK